MSASAARFSARGASDSGWAAAPDCSAPSGSDDERPAQDARPLRRCWCLDRPVRAAPSAAGVGRMRRLRAGCVGGAAGYLGTSSRAGATSSRQVPSSLPSSSYSPLWLMVDARQRSMTESIMSRSGDAPAAMRVLPPASLVGRSAAGTSRNFIRVGSGDAGAEREHLAGAERGNEGQHARAGVRDRRADQRLVAVVRQPHHEQRAALGDDVGVDLGRPLRHEAEEHAVLAAFLGDARQRAPGRAEADLGIGRRVAVRLLADEQQRRGAVAPQAEVERHARQHRHHRVRPPRRESPRAA